MQPHIGAVDSRWSIISSAEDLYPKPTPALLGIVMKSLDRVSSVDMSLLLERCNERQRRWAIEWPGEHYRLLAALAATQRPRTVVEIGTFTGMGCLAVRSGCQESRVITYDVISWQEISGTVLRDPDITSGFIEQRVMDLSDPAIFEREREILIGADMIIVDGPHNGWFEKSFLTQLLPLSHGQLLILDDIRLIRMIKIWRDLDLPKIDLTGFGHWSGTGVALSE